jgi:hypothetical protein
MRPPAPKKAENTEIAAWLHQLEAAKGAKMAKAKKKLQPKTGLMDKIKDLLPTSKRKKATPGRAYKNALAAKKSGRFEMTQNEDPAHSPGHRKLKFKASPKGKKNKPQNESAENNMARNSRIQQKESNQRRVITGAAIGKYGRRLA